MSIFSSPSLRHFQLQLIVLVYFRAFTNSMQALWGHLNCFYGNGQIRVWYIQDTVDLSNRVKNDIMIGFRRKKRENFPLKTLLHEKRL